MQSLFLALSPGWPLGGRHAGHWHVWGPHQGRRALRQGPNPAGKGGSRIGPGQPGPLSCLGCSPSLDLSSWPQLLKCHFLSGLQWLCLPPPPPSWRPCQENPRLGCTEQLYKGRRSQVCVVVILGHVWPVTLALLGSGEEGSRPSWPGVLGSNPIV